MRQKDYLHPPALLSSLLQPTEPNQRVHPDLFGPVKTSKSGKSIFFHAGRSHNICKIGAPAK
jgi:hypothetical protein